MQKRLDQVPQAMALRRQTAEHPFGTLKAWMGATHFLTRALKRVSTEMSLQVLAYNMEASARDHGDRAAAPGHAGLTRQKPQIQRHAHCKTAPPNSSRSCFFTQPRPVPDV
jgi:hypothetical protein